MQIPDMEARIEAGIAAWRDLLAVMAPHGWVIRFGYTPREAAAMLRTHSTRGLEAVEAQLIRDFRKLSAASAVARLLQDLTLAAWSSVLTMAAKAHDRGEWQLAIPVWLIATEGVVSRHFPGTDTYGFQSTGGRRARKFKTLLAPFGSFTPPAADALLSVLTGLSRNSTDPTVFSRQTVLHGVRPIIGSERESIQCFLALEALMSLVKIGGRVQGALEK